MFSSCLKGTPRWWEFFCQKLSRSRLVFKICLGQANYFLNPMQMKKKKKKGNILIAAKPSHTFRNTLSNVCTVQCSRTFLRLSIFIILFTFKSIYYVFGTLDFAII
jgi:hypothetical protein